MLFFPVGYDQAVFSVGGDLVKNGSVPFRDFLDTKPPLIFYIYGFASILFGSHDWTIRLFDILYHLVAVVLFYKLLERNGMNRNLAFGSALLYILAYTGTGFWMTAQAETFALIPTLVAVDLTLRFIHDGASAIRRGIVVGSLGVFLFLIKYTLLIAPLSFVLFLFVIDRIGLQLKVKFALSVFGTILIGIGTFALYLYIVGGLDTWIESFAWLSGYSTIEPLLDKHAIKDRYIRLLTERTGDAFSLSLVIAAGIGIYRSYRMEESKYRAFLMFCMVAFGFGIAATLYERKLFTYHFLKSLWAFIPLAAVGSEAITKLAVRAWRSAANLLKRLFIALALAVFLFYSPVMSFIGQPLLWIYYKVAGINADEVIQRRLYMYPLVEMHQLADSLRPQLQPSDEVFLWGTHPQLYSFINRLPQTISLTNVPLVTAWTPLEWKEKLYRQLKEQAPEYIIIEKSDRLTWVTASPNDSHEHFLEDPTLRSMLINYDTLMSFKHFDVFRLKTGNPHGRL